MHPQVTKSLCLLLTGTILSIVLIVLGEAIVPDMLIKGLHDKLTKDTQSKLDEWTDDPTWGARTAARARTAQHPSSGAPPARHPSPRHPAPTQAPTPRCPSRCTT